MENKEIEFKNILTKEQYNKIYNYYKLDNELTIVNKNYYYETKNKSLKKHNAALRIRHNNILKEITLKIKYDKENIEINIPLLNNDIPEIIKITELPFKIKEKLLKLKIEEDFLLSQKIETVRKEKNIDKFLLVLDKTLFINGIEDYELEFEVDDYNKGKEYFDKLLNDFSIEKKEALPKIARAEKYLKKQ